MISSSVFFFPFCLQYSNVWKIGLYQHEEDSHDVDELGLGALPLRKGAKEFCSKFDSHVVL